MIISYSSKILDVTGINWQVDFISNNLETTIVQKLFMRSLGLEILKSQVSKIVNTKHILRIMHFEATNYIVIPVEKLQQFSLEKSKRCVV